MADKKSSPVGCLIYLLIVAPPFFFFPIGVAIGFTAVITVIALVTAEMHREVKKLKQRKVTNKSTISAARNGFVELVAKIKNIETINSWLDREAIDYSEVFISKMYSRSNGKSEKLVFYSNRSHKRKMKISDGSAECWVSLHHVTMHLNTKRRRIKKEELLTLLADRPLPDFPMKALEDRDTFWVEEQFIPKDSYVYFYGIMNTLLNETLLQDLLKHGEDKRYRRVKEYALTTEDWEEITASFGGKAKLLTADYSPPTYVENVIISLKGDTNLRIKTYINLCALSLFIIVSTTFYGLYLWKAHPLIFEKIIGLLGL